MNQKPVCVAGMHRSGTSMVARLLAHAGISMGEQTWLMAPVVGNTQGLWEHRSFHAINEQLLTQANARWDAPPADLPAWQQQLPAAAETLDRAAFDVSPGQRWGWKDPRSSLTLPLWRTLWPELQLIVCLRNPLEVALSLVSRDHLPLEAGLALWEAYNLSICRCSAPSERLVTHYDTYQHAPHAELERLLAYLEIEQGRADEAVPHIKRDLRHHQLTVEHLLASTATDAQVALYLQLHAEAGQHATALPDAQELLRQRERYREREDLQIQLQLAIEAAHSTYLRQRVAQLEQLELAVQLYQTSIQEKDRYIASLLTLIEARETEIANFHTYVRSLKNELERLQERL